MDRTAADAYVYAKACGMYGRSYTGLKAKKLFEIKRLQDLWTLLFSDDVPVVPEGMLALLLERKSVQQVVSDYIVLLSAYDSPDPLARALIARYDYANLKSALSSLLLGNAEAPFMVDLGKFSIFHHDKWPDIAAMTAGTSLSWCDHIPDAEEEIVWETRIDNDYYRLLWTSLKRLNRSDREAADALIADEIILQNIVWAMRLRVYYQKTAEDILPLLACNGEQDDERLCGPAREILSWPLDTWEPWSSWQYKWLLNQHEEGVPWFLDPRWAQLSSDNYLYRQAISGFHQKPFTAGVLASFFRIKQLEEQMIRVAAEGLRLGATEEQMKEFMGGGRNV